MRWLVPEVLQTSMMDCGPAALQSALLGLGLEIDYEKLREFCGTTVDGTELAALDETALTLGLDVEQELTIAELLRYQSKSLLPAIMPIQLPGGAAHFVVVWRSVGPWVQIMDPGEGRRWTTWKDLQSQAQLYPVPFSEEEMAGWTSDDSLGQLLVARAKRSLGIRAAQRRVTSALDSGWRGVSDLDAALRVVEKADPSLSSKQANHVVDELISPGSEPSSILAPYKRIRSSASGGVSIEGPILLTLRVTSKTPTPGPAWTANAKDTDTPTDDTTRGALWGFTGAAAVGAALATFVEAVLFRILVDASALLTVRHQQFVLFLVATAVVVLSAGLRWGHHGLMLQAGRDQDVRLRQWFVRRLANMTDHFFQTRGPGDLVQRAHLLNGVREIPLHRAEQIGMRVDLIVTGLACCIMLPSYAPTLLVWILVVGVLLPALLLPISRAWNEKILACRGALSQFHLSALLGLEAMKAHRAHRTVRTAHDLLASARHRVGAAVALKTAMAEGIFLVVAVLGAIAHVWAFVDAHELSTGLILFTYWTTRIPMIAHRLVSNSLALAKAQAQAKRCIDPIRSSTLQYAPTSPSDLRASRRGPIKLTNCQIHHAKKVVLSVDELSIEPGEHVAIVGPSGSGKSTFLSLILGLRHWTGLFEMNGQEQSIESLRAHRRQMAWLSPEVFLWNWSIEKNIKYGNDAPLALRSLEASGLLEVLGRRPNGLGTITGEDGRGISGGDGQRVRIARAMAHPGPEFAVLDEPFRGLPFDVRGEMLRRVRAQWSEATFLFATHDLSLTRGFDRVLVLRDGQLAEAGAPEALCEAQGLYAQMLASHEVLLPQELARWKTRTMRDGRLVGDGV